MCARMEAQRVRKSVSTFAPSATNSAILHLLGENAPSSGLNPIQVRYRTALRPEIPDAKALRCRGAGERLPHPTQPLHQTTVGARPHPSFLTSTRRIGASASTYPSQPL